MKHLFCIQFSYRDLSGPVSWALDSGPVARILGSTSEILPCTLMVPGACKIRRRCNVLQVPIQYYTSGSTKAGKPFPPWRIKIVMACLRTILRDESPTVGNSSLYCSSPTLNPTYQPQNCIYMYPNIPIFFQAFPQTWWNGLIACTTSCKISYNKD